MLRNHATKSTVPINGWKSMFFGLPFVVAGVLIVLVALGRISVPKYAPNWLIGFLAALFITGGLLFVTLGIKDLKRRSAWLRESSAQPDEPWLADYPWRREGIEFSEIEEMLQRLSVALGWTMILAILGWLGAHKPDGWPIWLALSCLSLCCLMLWGRWAASVVQLARYGKGYLYYGEFPFRLGGELHASLRAPRHVSSIDRLTITLRCVEERYVTKASGPHRTNTVECYEIYKDVIQLNVDRLAGLGHGDVPIEFRVPAGQPSTDLTARPPIYWEIEVKGHARGVGYAALFLVPIYNPK